MIRRPPRTTRTVTLFPYTTLFRSKLAEPDLSGPLERLAQHDERFLGEIVGGHHEIGLFVIEHVDLVRVDELRQLERLLRFELDRVDLVLVEQEDRKSTRLNSSH